jgi:site-specific DNA-methyltransferase (adenine-specific)
MKEVIVYKRVSELKGNPKNPRFNENAVDKVALSIQRYGFRNPLIIDENNIVWCGNTRLKAATKLGLEEAPCIVVKDLTPKQMEEYALLDNKTNEIAEWDFDLLSEILPDLDLDDFDLPWGIVNQEVNIDDFFTDAEPKEKEPKKIQCPHCGEWFEV